MKRLAVMAFVASIIPLSAAHAQIAVSISTPQFGFTIGAPVYRAAVRVVPVYAPQIYAPPIYAPRVFAPVPVYGPRPVFVPAIAPVFTPVPIYRPAPRVIYVPRPLPYPHHPYKPRPQPDYLPYSGQQQAGWLPPGQAKRVQFAQATHGDGDYVMPR